MPYQPELISTKRYLVILGVCLGMASCNMEPAHAKDKPYVSSVVQIEFVTPDGEMKTATQSYTRFDCATLMKEMNIWTRAAVKRGIFLKARAKCYPLKVVK